MTIDELKKAIKAKTIELEVGTSLQQPRDELLKIYKELKELQFKLVQAENNPANKKQPYK